MRKITFVLSGIGLAVIAVWYLLSVSITLETATPNPSDSPTSALPQDQTVSPEIGRDQDQSQRTGENPLVPANKARTASRPAVPFTTNAQLATVKGYQTDSNEYRVLAIRRMNLTDISQLRDLATDPSPIVREATLERLRQLEGEYEIEARIERQPGESGQFLSTVLDALSTESDPFAIKSALDYLGEYGENDPRAAQTLEQLLQSPDLPATILMQIGELLAENYGLSPEQVKQLLLDSPSAAQLLDNDLNSLDNPQSDEDVDSTALR